MNATDEAAALAALDAEALLGDAAALLRVPSVTGQERPALEALAELAAARRLRARRPRATSCGA